jgi:hypothetical protein
MDLQWGQLLQPIGLLAKKGVFSMKDVLEQ